MHLVNNADFSPSVILFSAYQTLSRYVNIMVMIKTGLNGRNQKGKSLHL